MDIRTSAFQPSRVKLRPPSDDDSQTFFMNLDPFSGVKRAIGDTFETAGDFVVGALPLYATYHNGETAIVGGFSGRGNKVTRVAAAGAGLNAVGSLSLGVAAVQALLGQDSTTALMVAGAALGGSGLVSAGLG